MMALSLGSPPSHLLPALFYALLPLLDREELEPRYPWGQSRSCHCPGHTGCPILLHGLKDIYVVNASSSNMPSCPDSCSPLPGTGASSDTRLCLALGPLHNCDLQPPGSLHSYPRCILHPPISHPEVSRSLGTPLSCTCPPDHKAPWVSVAAPKFLLYPRQAGQDWGH